MQVGEERLHFQEFTSVVDPIRAFEQRNTDEAEHRTHVRKWCMTDVGIELPCVLRASSKREGNDRCGENDRVAKSTIKNELRRRLRASEPDLAQNRDGRYLLGHGI